MFPLVASIRMSPGLSLPSCSAFSTIALATRSFTEPPALWNSSLARTSALMPSDCGRVLRRTIGVCSMRWMAESKIGGKGSSAMAGIDSWL